MGRFLTVMGALLGISALADAETLGQSYQRVLETHPAVIRSTLEVDRQRARTDLSMSAFKPQLELSFSENRIDQETLSAQSEFDGQSNRANVSQSLIDLAGLQGLKREQQLTESVSTRVLNVKARLAQQLTERYVRLLGAQSRQNAISELVQSLQSRLAQATAMQQRGQLSRLDVLRVQSRLAERKAELSSAQSQVDRALAALLELDPEITIANVASPDTTRIDWPVVNERSALVDAMYQLHPELQALSQQIDAEMFGLQAVERRRWPRLSLTASYEQSNIGSNNRQISDTDTTVYGLTLSWPLYRGGALSAEKTEQAAVVNQLETDHLATGRFLKRSLDEAIAQFENGRRAAAVESENVEGQRQAVDVLTQAYDRGAVSQSELLDALDNLASARISRDQAILDGLIGWISIRVLSGQFQPSDLDFVDAVAAQFRD